MSFNQYPGTTEENNKLWDDLFECKKRNIRVDAFRIETPGNLVIMAGTCAIFKLTGHCEAFMKAGLEVEEMKKLISVYLAKLEIERSKENLKAERTDELIVTQAKKLIARLKVPNA